MFRKIRDYVPRGEGLGLEDCSGGSAPVSGQHKGPCGFKDFGFNEVNTLESVQSQFFECYRMPVVRFWGLNSVLLMT